MIGLFFLSLLVAFTGAAAPGPLMAVTVNQALLTGWSAGLWLSLGHVLAELGLVAALRAGVGGVLKRRAVTRAIGVIGGAVLLYLAWGMVNTALGGALPSPRHAGKAALTGGMLMAQGALLSVTNPTWHVWWATAGIGVIAGQVDKHGARAWPVFYVGHSLADLIWYVGVSALIAAGGSLFSESVHRGLILVCGLIVGVIGLIFLARPALERMRNST